MKREDYLPEDLLPLPFRWLLEGHPDFKGCPNSPDKIWVLSSGGYILYDRRKEDIATEIKTLQPIQSIKVRMIGGLA